MPLPHLTVLAQFTNPESADFVFDDPATGLFDDGLFGGTATADITEYVTSVSIRRGRSNALDDFAVGQATITLDDNARIFDASNTASPYAGDLGPGRLIVIKSFGVTIFTGRTSGYASTDTFAYGNTTVTLTVEDLLASLGRRPMTAWTTTEQLAGARIEAVLNRSEVALPVAQRSIDAGVSTMQADNVSAGSSTLNYLQLIARSDYGRLFASADDLLVFQDRAQAALTPVAVRIMDDPVGAMDIEPIRVTRSNTIRDQFNRVVVDREGGIAQSSALTDSEILEQGGVRTLSRTGLLLNSDTVSQYMADWLLGIYSTPTNRVREIVLPVATLELATAQVVLGLELGERVSMSWTPNQVGALIEATLAVEALTHTITSFDQTIAVGVSVVDNSTPFVFDDDTWGLFDGPGLFIF